MSGSPFQIEQKQSRGVETLLRHWRALPKWTLLARVALVFLPLACVLLARTVWVYGDARAELDQRLIASQQSVLEQLRHRTVHGLESVVRDVIFLAELAANERPGVSDQQRVELLSQEMTALARSRGTSYDQVRMIDKYGQEIIRIDASGQGPLRVQQKDLQNKSDRYYVKATLAQQSSTIYMSPLDLNVDSGRVTLPLKPMIRMGLKLGFGRTAGEGAVFVNYLGSDITAAVRAVEEPNGSKVWLLNEKGYWLVGPTPELEWRFMFPDQAQQSLASELPQVWQKIQNTTSKLPSSGLVGEGLVSSLDVTPESGLEVQGYRLAAEPGSRWRLVTWMEPAQREQQHHSLWLRYTLNFAWLCALLLLLSTVIAVSWYLWRLSVASLRARDEQIAEIFEGAPNAILATDATGRLVAVNEQATALLGYRRGDLLAQPVASLFVSVRPKHGEEINRKLLDAGGWPKALDGIVQMHQAQGTEVPVVVKVRKIQSDHHAVWVGALRDVSQELAAEHALLESNSLLALANHKLEFVNRELESFSYSVSHDLRSPLRSMGAMSQILIIEHGKNLNDEGLDFLRRIVAAARRMNDLIDDLLSLSRVSMAELDVSEVDLTEMATSIIADLRAREPARQVEVKIQEGLKAQADKGLARIALTNLLGNAWKYTSKKEQAIIEFGCALFDGEPLFFLRDNGAGFDMKNAGKLFQPFQRLHTGAEFPGTGIGLATVNRVFGKHGGRITVEASPERGAEFRFRF